MVELQTHNTEIVDSNPGVINGYFIFRNAEDKYHPHWDDHHPMMHDAYLDDNTTFFS